ncbi:MAG: ImmA/IrrE family metallo-endopeptidase [Alphaproteobacteria bacterium]|nr:ImmA/IrrE family metallo-endopeptidase [Alphaproteobacteria bacterium]
MTIRFEITEQEKDLRLAVLVDGEAVWPHPGIGDEASDFDAEDIMSYLVDAWPSLLLTQTFPIPFDARQMPRSLTGLMGAAEARWDNFGVNDRRKVENEQSRLDAFLYAHDLSQMKFGAGLEPFYVLRSGPRMRIETFNRFVEGVAFTEFVAAMEGLGDKAARLLGANHSLVIRWHKRDFVDPETVLAFIGGLPQANGTTAAAEMAPLKRLVADRMLSEIANDNRQPILAAARGAGALGVTSLCAVTKAVRKLRSGDGTPLATFRVQHVHPHLRDIINPTDQGIRVANEVRTWLSLSGKDVVDLAHLSKKLLIEVYRVKIHETRLDGLAVTAGDHGPSVLLNTKTSRHGNGPGDLERSLNFTWAHEIGHLLMDDPEEWPVLVDTLSDTQRLPRMVETRANAFATYLLLPVSTAQQRWEEADKPQDWPNLEKLLNTLAEMYKLPRIVVARQVRRGLPEDNGNRVQDIFLQNIPGFYSD